MFLFPRTANAAAALSSKEQVAQVRADLSKADSLSETANFTVAFAPVRVADCSWMTGGVLSTSKLTLSSSPVRAVAGEFDGASLADTFT